MAYYNDTILTQRRFGGSYSHLAMFIETETSIGEMQRHRRTMCRLGVESAARMMDKSRERMPRCLSDVREKGVHR